MEKKRCMKTQRMGVGGMKDECRRDEGDMQMVKRSKRSKRPQ